MGFRPSEIAELWEEETAYESRPWPSSRIHAREKARKQAHLSRDRFLSKCQRKRTVILPPEMAASCLGCRERFVSGWALSSHLASHQHRGTYCGLPPVLRARAR